MLMSTPVMRSVLRNFNGTADRLRLQPARVFLQRTIQTLRSEPGEVRVLE